MIKNNSGAAPNNEYGHDERARKFEETGLNAIAPTLILKRQELPLQRLAEEEDFVEFPAAREMCNAAGARLGESLAKLDALNLPALSDDEIKAEIQAARRERATPLQAQELTACSSI